MKLEGERVREGRERLALSIENASEKARVSPHTWVRAEHGDEIRPSSARRVAEALGAEPGQLMEGPALVGIMGEQGFGEEGLSAPKVPKVSDLTVGREPAKEGGDFWRVEFWAPVSERTAVYEWMTYWVPALIGERKGEKREQRR